MRFQYLSDCHLEFIRYPDPTNAELIQHPDADVVVLAGDFGTQKPLHLAMVERFVKGCTVPIVYVMGNHDFYYNSMTNGRDKFRELLERRDDVEVHVLENNFVTIGDVTFFGTPLWTDFNLPGNTVPPELQAKNIQDFYSITHRRRPISWKQYLAKFHQSVEFLSDYLNGDRISKRVVVTHWPPNMKSIGPQFEGDPLNPYFINQLPEDLVSKADVWIHGHTHGSSDYTVGNCRVLANPRGYPVGDRYENPDFNPVATVKV